MSLVRSVKQFRVGFRAGTSPLSCVILDWLDTCLWDIVVGLYVLGSVLHGLRWNLVHLSVAPFRDETIYDLLSFSMLVTTVGHRSLLSY